MRRHAIGRAMNHMGIGSKALAKGKYKIMARLMDPRTDKSDTLTLRQVIGDAKGKKGMRFRRLLQSTGNKASTHGHHEDHDEDEDDDEDLENAVKKLEQQLRKMRRELRELKRKL